MILVTVGTQLPFDRLIGYINEWCSLEKSPPQLTVQVGDSNINSEYFECVKSIEPRDFSSIVTKCDFIVSHAGMGSILTALKYSKPVVILPRSAKLGEHRNDHQFHTARSFKNTPGVYVVESKEELFDILTRKDELVAGSLEPSGEYESLLSHIHNVILEKGRR